MGVVAARAGTDNPDTYNAEIGSLVRRYDTATYFRGRIFDWYFNLELAVALDVVLGETRNAFDIDALLVVLEPLALNGTLYVGYPVLASLDAPIIIDALLTCLEHSVVAFDLAGQSSNARTLDLTRERQNSIYIAIHQKLLSYRALQRGRELAVELNVISLDPMATSSVTERDLIVGPVSALPALLDSCGATQEPLLQAVNAAIQRVGSLRPSNRRSKATTQGSKGSILKEIEAQIANLDRWQKRAAIESPEGPQRIRGLAGSGKTVVLALKAALLHASRPEWRIAVTFHTRALYQQFQELIRRFTYDHSGLEPDWEHLQLLHSWGSASRPGVYSEICAEAGVDPISFSEARERFGADRAFEGICEQVRQALESKKIPPRFDAVLIDEGQDLPASFFQMVYHATTPPHRIVFAYDELQNLSRDSMLPPEELFGTKPDDSPRVTELRNPPNAPRQDIVLPICYRNTPWALTAAHALGFGVYREGGPVQFFDRSSLWDEIGYEVVTGQLTPGSVVELRRRVEAAPNYFARLMDETDAMSAKVFTSIAEQAAWVASEIERNLDEDELDHGDILIVFPDALAAKRDAVDFQATLGELGIASHLAGVTSSVDKIFKEASIAMTGIYRAKGNEAAVVYVVNAQYGVGDTELIKRRNALFTAITRSRAWVRICGVGARMQKIAAEIEAVRAAEYCLNFRVPTAEETVNMRRLHRERSPEERRDLASKKRSATELAEQIESGEIPIEVLLDAIPEELRRKLAQRLADDA